MTLSDRLELELELELVEQTTPPGHFQAQQTGDIFSGHTATPPPHHPTRTCYQRKLGNIIQIYWITLVDLYYSSYIIGAGVQF